MDELEIIRHRQIEGMSLFLDTVDYRTSHFHPEWELVWVLENPLQVVCSQQSYTVPENELVLLNPNSLHEFHKVTDSSTFLCIQIAPSLFPGIENLAVDAFWVSEHTDADEIRRCFREAAYCYLRQEPHYALKAMGLAALIFHQLFTRMPSHTMTVEEAQNRDRRNARLKRLQQYVDENYMHKIRLSDFAEAEGCSMSYLSHFVKDSLNQTFQEYVNTVRFNFACKLIASGNTKMLDVCMESGFSDYRYFTRTFRQQCGMTPEQYRHHLGVSVSTDVSTRHNLHSLERFYTFAQSISILDRVFGEK